MRTDYRATVAACYLAYAAQATFNFTPLLYLTFCDVYGLSLTDVSLLIALNFGTQLLTDALSPFCIRKIGYRGAAVSSCLFIPTGLVGLFLLPRLFSRATSGPLVGLIVATVLLALGAGMLETVVSPLLEACPTGEGKGVKAGAMALLHSMYSWGQAAVILFSTLYFAAFGVDRWEILACLWAVPPLVAAVFFCFVPIYTLDADVKKTPLSAFLKKKTFWLFFVLMLCAGASEMIVSQWASAFAESRLGLDKSLGDLAGPFLFAATVASIRVLYGLGSRKYDLRRAMALSCVCNACGCLLAFLGPNAVLSLIGCFLCGVGVAILWPGTYSEAARLLPEGGVAMFALLALAGDVGCLFGPSAAGWIASYCGGDLRYAFLFALVFPVLGVLCILGIGRKEGPF